MTGAADHEPGRSDPDQPWPDARQQAWKVGLTRLSRRSPVTIPLSECVGLVLAADITSLTDLPAFNTAAMDGWAVNGDAPWTIVGDLRAGDPVRSLAPGDAVRISTGAMVPDDSRVLRSEYGSESSGWLELRAGHDTPGVHADTRLAGEEVRRGELICEAGWVLTPPAVGLVAAAGHDSVSVRPPGSVQIAILGDELVDHGLPEQGRVRDALTPQLPAWVEDMSGRLTDIVRVEDNLDDTVGIISSCTSDVLVTTGGTARGPADHLRAAVDRLGGDWIVDGVAVRPGHPMKLAALPDGRFVVALPGNPLAAISALITLGEPLLAALSGRPQPASMSPHSQVSRPLGASIESSPGAHRLIPARIDDGHVQPMLRRGPAMLSGLAAADVLAVIPPADGTRQPGDTVLVLPLPWGTGLVV